jgi:1-acyl-sn-glycerol-3-phosphate acyltransferase
MRSLLRSILRVVLRIFFRRIEVSGTDRVPVQGPVLFVLTHPNGLIDPAFALCLAPRRVSFLAKAPLFRMPVIGSVCRAFDAIPVHRRQDAGTDPAQNRETFEAARRVLAGGGAIAIFPEGTSHGDPRLRPFKTGAARIALGAAAALATRAPIRIVPAGLYYRAKQTFRSAALLYFGDPFSVTPVPLAAGVEPPAGPVRELTARIATALGDITPQAERTEVLALIERAHRIFSTADEPPETSPSLSAELEVKRRFALGLPLVRARWPDRLTAIQSRIDRYETTLRVAGLDPHHVTPSYSAARVVQYVVPTVALFLLLLPAAIVGGLIHYPAYRIVGYVATGVAKGDEEALATVKVLAAALLFPLTWGAVATAVWLRFGAPAAVAALCALPFLGYGSLVVFERLDRVIGRARALGVFLFRRRAFLRLVAERRAIRAVILGLAKDLEGART